MVEYIEREKVLSKAAPVAGCFSDMISAYDIIMLPAEDVVPVRHGRIVQTLENGRMKRVFSCCGTDFTKLTSWMAPNYCPNCGAKMDGGAE